MNEKELQEEVVILDKACRFAAQELANGGINALEAHIRMANAMLAKFQRLVAETERQQQAALAGDEAKAGFSPCHGCDNERDCVKKSQCFRASIKGLTVVEGDGEAA